MNRFVFPPDQQQEELQYIYTLGQLKQKIRKLWDQTAPFHKSMYRFWVGSIKKCAQKIHVKCQYCNSKLEYTKVEGEQLWRNVSFQNYHDHSRKLVTKQSKHNEMMKAQNYLKNFIDDYEKQALKQLALSKFSITPSNFNAIYNKIRHKNQQNTNFQHFLKNLKHFVICFPSQFQILPSRLLIFDQQMKELYQRFGDCIWLTQVFAAVSKYQKFYLFSGKNNKNRLIIFGLVMISNNECEDNLSEALIDFMERMGHSPGCIFSRADKIIKQSMERINRNNDDKIDHFMDISQQLGECEQIRQIMQKLVTTENEKQYTQIIHDIENLHFNHPLLDFVLTHPNQFCLINRKTFIAYPFTYYPSIKPLHKTNMTLTDKINTLLNYAANTNKQSQYVWVRTIRQLPLPSNIFDLKFLSNNLCSQIFEALLKEFNQTTNCNIVSVQEFDDFILWKVREHKGEQCFVDFEVKVEQNNRVWECSCYFRVRSGICCRHILKIGVRTGLRVEELVERRWWINEGENIGKGVRRGAGKSTRSNILK